MFAGKLCVRMIRAVSSCIVAESGFSLYSTTMPRATNFKLTYLHFWTFSKLGATERKLDRLPWHAKTGSSSSSQLYVFVCSFLLSVPIGMLFQKQAVVGLLLGVLGAIPHLFSH